MRRRDFMGLIASAAAWPFAPHAQQKAHYPIIGVVMGASPDDAESQRRVKAFEFARSELGWTEGRNIHVDYRWADPLQMRSVVAALVASTPDVIVVNGTSALDAVRAATNSIPVIFTGISDRKAPASSRALPAGWQHDRSCELRAFHGRKMAADAEGNSTAPDPVGVLRISGTQERILQSVKDNAASSAMEAIDCPVLTASDIRAAIQLSITSRAPVRSCSPT